MNMKQKEQRVNVPIGSKKSTLRAEAKKAGTTETNLARLLILDGISRLASGEFVIRTAAIVSKGPP